MLPSIPSTFPGSGNYEDEAVDPGEEGEGMKVSSWNHAGTWEEKDMTEYSIIRIKSLCLDAEARDIVPVSSGHTVRAYVTGKMSTVCTPFLQNID